MQATAKQVKTLLGHKGLSFSIACLQSFVSNCSEPVQLKIFEDGTLTPEDIILLQASFAGCIVVDLAHCNAAILNKLAPYPGCLRYRKEVVYARKIFDLMLYDDEDCLYIDSDIYFLQPYTLPSFTDIPVFMYDSQNGYSFKPGEFRKIVHPVYPRVNSGFFFFPYKSFDLAFIEQLLSDPIVFQGFLRGISWLEQTIWAFSAFRCGNMYYFSPQQVIMATEKLKVTDKTVCVHLVSTYRGHFDTVKTLRRVSDTKKTVQLALEMAKRPLKAHQFFTERVIKRLRRYL